MKSRPEITEQEIRQFMDFDRLLAERNKLLANDRAGLMRNIAITVLTAMMITGALYVFVLEKESPINDEKEQTASGVTPAARESEAVPDSSAENSDPERTQEPKKNTVQQKVTEKQVIAPSGTAEDESITPKTDDVYIQASPVNGYPALYDYFSSALTYPAEAVSDSINGVVTVIFTINKEGKPVNIQFENSLGKPFDDEARRIVEKMPAWKPASYNGKPVPSKISLPLTFDVRKVNK